MNPIFEMQDICGNFILINIPFIVSIEIRDAMNEPNKKIFEVVTQKKTFKLDEKIGTILYKKYRLYGETLKGKENEPPTKHKKIHRVS
jgi:hypothetical protein